jgi:hypothetical protein
MKIGTEMPSMNGLGRKNSKASERTFTVDGKFFRDEAREAIRSYFMPFVGIYAAAVGKEVRVVNGAESKPRTGHTKKAIGSSPKSKARSR